LCLNAFVALPCQRFFASGKQVVAWLDKKCSCSQSPTYVTFFLSVVDGPRHEMCCNRQTRVG